MFVSFKSMFLSLIDRMCATFSTNKYVPCCLYIFMHLKVLVSQTGGTVWHCVYSAVLFTPYIHTLRRTPVTERTGVHFTTEHESDRISKFIT